MSITRCGANTSLMSSRIAPLDFAARLDGVGVAVGAPALGEIFGVEFLGARLGLVQHELLVGFERVLHPVMGEEAAQASALDELRTVSR